MVVSSKKKKRGQQRKAAQNEDAAVKALGRAAVSRPGERVVDSQKIEHSWLKRVTMPLHDLYLTLVVLV